MKNITLSAKEEHIQRARRVARERRSSLNQLFRDWLATLDSGESRARSYREHMSQLCERSTPGSKRFSREDMNER